VPADWKTAEPPICTPPIALVRYANKICFVVESNRLSVSDSQQQAVPDNSPIPDLAAKYIKILTHVRYNAVGINFLFFKPQADSEALLIRRFLKDGPWNSGSNPLRSLALRLKYAAEPGELNLSCETVTMPNAEVDTAETGLRIHANYHLAFSSDNPLGLALDAIGLFRNRYAHAVSWIKTLFGQEE